MEALFEKTLERYLSLRSAELLPTTIAHYRNAVTSLIEFLRLHYADIDSFAKLRRDPHLEGWLQMLSAAQPPYTNDTRRQFIFPVRRFLKDIRKWNWPENPPPGLLLRSDLPPRMCRSREHKSKAADISSNQTTLLPDTSLHCSLKRYLDIRGATLRPNTIQHYKTDILSLIEFLQRCFPELDSFSNLKRYPHIEGWLGELAKAQPPYKNVTRRNRIRDVRRFLEDIYEWGWPESPPIGLILRQDFPPPQHYLPKPLPPDVDALLMEGLEEEADLISLGLILARRTGLRIGELCRLEMDCLLENSGGRYSLRVPLGKLYSERVIPIDQETADLIKALRKMRGERPSILDPETGRTLDLIFLNHKNSFTRGNTFSQRLKSVAKSLGISQNVHPHRLRHTYATELLRYGVSLPGVMKLLGHKTLKMTLRYVEVTNEDLGRDYLKALEKARHQYASLELANTSAAEEPEERREPLTVIEATFDQLVARIQGVRFDHPNPKLRKKLQRFVERLRRAQSELSNLLRRP